MTREHSTLPSVTIVTTLVSSESTPCNGHSIGVTCAVPLVDTHSTFPHPASSSEVTTPNSFRPYGHTGSIDVRVSNLLCSAMHERQLRAWCRVVRVTAQTMRVAARLYLAFGLPQNSIVVIQQCVILKGLLDIMAKQIEVAPIWDLTNVKRLRLQRAMSVFEQALRTATPPEIHSAALTVSECAEQLVDAVEQVWTPEVDEK